MMQGCRALKALYRDPLIEAKTCPNNRDNVTLVFNNLIV